jgi:hypothetical protein
VIISSLRENDQLRIASSTSKAGDVDVHFSTYAPWKRRRASRHAQAPGNFQLWLRASLHRDNIPSVRAGTNRQILHRSSHTSARSFSGVILLCLTQRTQLASAALPSTHSNVRIASQKPRQLRTRQLYDTLRERNLERPNKSSQDGAHFTISLLPPLGHGSASTSVSQHLASDATAAPLHRREFLPWVIKDEEARSTSATAQEEARNRNEEGGGLEMSTHLDDWYITKRARLDVSEANLETILGTRNMGNDCRE